MSDQEKTLLLLQSATVATTFLASAVLGGIGWVQRSSNRTKLGCVVASANCGAVGFLFAGAFLVYSQEAYLQAFMSGASTGWITGRYGLKKLPEILGLLMRVLKVLRDESMKR